MVQWFNDPAHSGLCFVSSSLVADSFRLRSTSAAAERTPTSSSCNPLTLFTPQTKNIKKPSPSTSLRNRVFKWSHLESNQAPTDYESVALTEWAIGPLMRLRNYYYFIFVPNVFELDFYITSLLYDLKTEPTHY